MRKSVIEIIPEQSGIKLSKLPLNSRLEQDLGITGDDLWEIIEAMDSEYSIDWCDVDFSYYFYPEVTGFFWSLFNRDKSRSIRSFPITISHLVAVSQSGKWSKPE